MALWLFRRDGELVLVGLMKEEKFPKRVTGMMWEVMNGIHLRNTRAALSFSNASPDKVLDQLLCLQAVDLGGVVLERLIFAADAEQEFWKCVGDNQMHNVIIKSRLTP